MANEKPMTSREADDTLRRMAFEAVVTNILARLMQEKIALSPDPEREVEDIREDLHKLARRLPENMRGFMAEDVLTEYTDEISDKFISVLRSLLERP
jgi:hypothetical protein